MPSRRFWPDTELSKMRNTLHPLRTWLKTLLAAALLFSISASADCVLPAAPSRIPDGHSANEQEMQAAIRTLKQYNDDVDEYMKCLEFEQRRNLISFGDKEKDRGVAIDSLSAVVGHFNEQLRIFKSRHS
jgi:hypothetical protein